MPAPKRIVIIGAGPGGLAAAMLVQGSAGDEVDVTLIERLDRVGGRCSTLRADTEHGEFRFDMGPTFFLYPEVLEEVFSACGRSLRDEVDLIRLDPQYRLIFEATGKIDASPDLERTAAEVARIAPDDAANLERFILDNRRKFEAFKPILQRPWLRRRDLLDPMLARMLPLVRPWSSVDGDLKRYFRDDRIRLAFSFQSKYLGMSPFQCPSLFTILSYLEYDFGVFHPRGGCGGVSEAMARVAAELGVDVRLNEEVTRVDVDDSNRARRVVTDAGEYEADAVVINADFADAMTRLIPSRRRRWHDRKVEKSRYSCSTFMMYLGVEGSYDEAAHHTIFLAEDYARNLDEIERLHTLSDGPSCYVCNPCVTDDTMAPPGMSGLYVLAPVTHCHANVDWATRREGFREQVLSQLPKLGYEGVEARIVYEKTFTPVQWRDEMRVYRGATFNLAHTLGQMLWFRPHNRYEDVDGVYLVGGGTHPGSGLPVIYESARISAKLLLEDLGLGAAFDAALPTPEPPPL